VLSQEIEIVAGTQTPMTVFLVEVSKRVRDEEEIKWKIKVNMVHILEMVNILNLKYSGDQHNSNSFEHNMDFEKTFSGDKKLKDLEFYLNQVLSSDSSFLFTYHVR